MENINQNMPPEYQPPQPIFQPPHSSRKPILIGFLILVCLMGGYSVLANNKSWWPFVSKINSFDNWPKYSNTDYGFEFNYPNNWIYGKISSNNGAGIDSLDSDSSVFRLYFHAPVTYDLNNVGIIIEVVSPESKFSRSSLQDFIKSLKNQRGSKITNQQKIDIKDVEEAISVDESYDGSVVYNIVAIKKSGYIYVLSNPYTTTKTKIHYDKILSTFKLTIPQRVYTPISTETKVYTNNTFGFQITQLPGWVLQETKTGKDITLDISLARNPENVKIQISVGKIPLGKSVDTITPPEDDSGQPIKLTQVKISNYDARRIDTPYGPRYFLFHQTTAMDIVVLDPNMLYTLEINQLLSTLKFTN